ncbi:MAG: chromosomal replication initiator protein DnaA [Chloroflexi bacterium]|nr:chromosomal replication initiator protein DnaA [Chloroflexota bacterium]
MRYSSSVKRNYQDKSYRSPRFASAAQEKNSLFYNSEESTLDNEGAGNQTAYPLQTALPMTPAPTAKHEYEPAKPTLVDLELTEVDLDETELAEQQGLAAFDPHTIWQTLLSELALQMPSASYNTWVRDTWVIGYEDGEFLIGIPNAYARDWLENRLRSKIKRALSVLVQRSVQVNFRVCPRSVTDLPDAKPAPLYQMPAEEIGNGKHNVESKDGGNSPAVVDNKYGAQRTAESNQATPKERVSMTTASAMPVGSQLNPLHTFETFVVGNHNKLAHAAAEAVAENPGQSFNPLFIYGGVGLGKTHLLHAIGNRAQQLGYQMLYCSSEQFTNELIGSIRSQSTEQFRNKYRDVDLLLIDDIQFIGGKESTQEEFFHTFNHLHASGRQVILSSDRPPKALGTLEERLRSRFEGGLQTDISQPDYETRVAILQSKANRMGVRVDPGVLSMVAERVDSNIRELEGALNRLIMQARLAGSSLSVSLASSILNNLAPARTPCTPSTVLRIVAAYFRLQAEDLTGRKRTKEIATARQITMYLLREENGLSLPAIGEQLGGRDHSTVRYGVEQVTQDLEHDEDLRRAIVVLRDKMYMPFIG